MAKKDTKETFVEKVRRKHQNKLNLDEFEYINSITPSKCICNICGHIWFPRPDVLVRGHGCPKCYHKRNSKTKTTPFEEIQTKIKNITLNKETYIDTKHRCECKCDICGHAWNPWIRDLLNGHGCPNCAIERSKKRSDFSKQMREKYGDRYIFNENEYITKRDSIVVFDNEENKTIETTPLKLLSYQEHTPQVRTIDRQPLIDNFLSKTKTKFQDKFIYHNIDEYKNKHSILDITCKKHNNRFKVSGENHLRQQFGGCNECLQEFKGKITLPIWIKRCNERHQNKYNYEKVLELGENFNLYGNVEIGCSIHGWFTQNAFNHYHGSGCQKCGGSARLTTNEFKDRASKIHDGKYIYTKSEYVNNRIPVCIICPEHGEFWQTPNDHLDGCGCPKCKESHLERKIRILLENNKIDFATQQYFDWLRNNETNYKLPLDFYINNRSIAIECQGEQHFIANFYKSKGIEYAEEHLKGVQHRDQRKRELCKENGVELIYFLEKKLECYVKDLDNRYFTDVESLLSYIKEKENNEVMKATEIGSLF